MQEPAPGRWRGHSRGSCRGRSGPRAPRPTLRHSSPRRAAPPARRSGSACPARSAPSASSTPSATTSASASGWPVRARAPQLKEAGSLDPARRTPPRAPSLDVTTARSAPRCRSARSSSSAMAPGGSRTPSMRSPRRPSLRSAFVIVDPPPTARSEIAHEHTAVRVVPEVTVRSLSTAIGWPRRSPRVSRTWMSLGTGTRSGSGCSTTTAPRAAGPGAARRRRAQVAIGRRCRPEDRPLGGPADLRRERHPADPRRTPDQPATPGERDQGQYDSRSDVIAVATNGMLVRRDVFAELGALTPASVRSAWDVDFGWRAQLAGHRVVVVPAARVREASASATGDRRGSPSARRSDRQRRQASRQVALARSSALAAPLLGCGSASARSSPAWGCCCSKRPRHAWASGSAMPPPCSIPARSRSGTAAGCGGSHPGTSMASSSGPRAAARHTWDLVQGALTPSRTAGSGRPRRLWAPSSPGPVAEEAEGPRRRPCRSWSAGR